MPSKPHPAHLHYHLRHRLLSGITPTSCSPFCLSRFLYSHLSSGSSATLPPPHAWLDRSPPSHTPWPTHRSVFRTQIPHTGIQVCALPGLVMGVERQSTLRSDSEGCVRCGDAAHREKAMGRGQQHELHRGECHDSKYVYQFKEKLDTYQCPRFVSESLSLLSPEISWGVFKC